jgi:hypothetical protein
VSKEESGDEDKDDDEDIGDEVHADGSGLV